MDNWTFGITVTVVGMGGTLITLWLLGVLTNGLKKIFPIVENSDSSKKA